MKTYLLKLKHILPTFITVAFGTVLFLVLIRWIFAIQFPIIDIEEDTWQILLPVILPWIPILIWLRPRFRILTFKKDPDKGRYGFLMISWMVISAMSSITQVYLTEATAKLQQLSTINDIENVENVRYYKLKNFFTDSNLRGAYFTISTSERDKLNLYLDAYFVTAILADSSQKITSIPKYWYGVRFSKVVNNREKEAERESRYLAFYNECVEKINYYDFHSLDHFERTPTSNNRDNYLKAIEAKTKQATDNSFIVLEPIRERYEDRKGEKLLWIFKAFGIGLIVLSIFINVPGYDEEERRRFLAREKIKQDDLVDLLKFLVPKGNHFASSIILDLTILVFILMVISGANLFSPDGDILLLWGANRRFEVVNGEWWRLLSSVFLHGGIMHLFLNIYGLVIVSIFIEPLLGRKKYFILYLLSGICGSLASIWWHSNTLSVGASGAIFGLNGAMLGLLLINAFPLESNNRIKAILGIVFYITLNLVWGITGGIDNAAHIGGLLSGILIGILLYKRPTKAEENLDESIPKVEHVNSED